MKKGNNLTIKDITLIAILATLLFIQEQIFSFLPNIQLTVFLLVLYSKKIGMIKTIIITFIHVLLDNLVMGSFNIIYVPFMFIGWIIIPLLLNTLFKKVESNIYLALLGGVFSFVYCWIFIIPNCLVLNVDFISYLISDFVFEVILATSSFLAILLLYNPCSNIINKLIKK